VYERAVTDKQIRKIRESERERDEEEKRLWINEHDPSKMVKINSW